MKLEKTYNAKNYEDKIYEQWESSGVFSPKIGAGKKPFTIMMPPPNATGTLHLGHAVMLALEDIMIRYHRMKGDSSLWVPGTDHASIATQNKVEKLIAEEGLTRQKLGREKFLDRVHEFVKKSQNTIRRQIRKMGSSCDWSREKYTLDPSLSFAVREIFTRMYKDGLIYRGHRIVNWCPRCASTLADDEVEYREEHAKFYYFKYGPVVIGTARPETKFLDKTIIVHPTDKRYKHLHGKKFEVEWIDGKISANVIADPVIDPEFGTGAMTITPAHSFEDFDLAKKYDLPIVQIIDEKGNFTEAAGEFKGKNARESRDEIVKILQDKGLVERIDENYKHQLSVCYRCDTPIEPLVSKQWFISVSKKFRKGKSLKDIALEVVKKEKIKILPERFEKTYFHWMENLRDWCISRQIWFGHQIPVWYCIGGEKKESGEEAVKSGDACKFECTQPIVQIETPRACPHCGSNNLRQDPDTLDTWFSSGLWTFSTLGWPEKTADLKYFHPTNVLETGYDILFFWIARMILMTTYALNEVPFKYVYLHGLVRTREGKKMSKSHPETCIDPLDMIEKYGADALRLSMIIGATPGNDVRLYEEKIAGFRNFVNKIWNATRFALMQSELSTKTQKLQAISLADKWILTRTQELIKEVTEDIENFKFSDAGMKIYDFTWNEYCAWYLEISKGENQNLPVLNYVLETILALLHPFVPFVTEAIWKHMDKPNMLISHEWPKAQKKFIFEKESEQMSVVVEVISAIRNLRQESGIEPAKKLHAILANKKFTKLLEEKREVIMRLARISKLEILETAPSIHPALTHYTKQGVEILLPLAELIDVKAEIARLTKEKNTVGTYIKSLESKLNNKNFVSRAPKEIVDAEKEKLTASKDKLMNLTQKLANLTE